MDWFGLALVVAGIGLLALVVAMAWATYTRFTGRHSRFDAFAETMVRAQGARIYQPSLRPDPDAPAIEQAELSRADRAARETPARQESR